MSKLLIQCTIEELTQNDDTYWCDELLNYDYSDQNINERQSCVWDVRKGNILILDEFQKIVKGSHGCVKGEEFKGSLKHIYGDPPMYTEYNFPNK